MRLVGGSNTQGRLEVLHDGIWGTVCDDYFSTEAARVACKMLGSGYCTMIVVFFSVSKAKLADYTQYLDSWRSDVMQS